MGWKKEFFYTAKNGDRWTRVVFTPFYLKGGGGNFGDRPASGIPPPPPEAVKKSAWVFSSSFRRKPESSIFEPLKTSWTPVFTGVTTERQFFHSFPLQRGKSFLLSKSIRKCSPPFEKGRMGGISGKAFFKTLNSYKITNVDSSGAKKHKHSEFAPLFLLFPEAIGEMLRERTWGGFYPPL